MNTTAPELYCNLGIQSHACTNLYWSEYPDTAPALSSLFGVLQPVLLSSRWKLGSEKQAHYHLFDPQSAATTPFVINLFRQNSVDQQAVPQLFLLSRGWESDSYTWGTITHVGLKAHDTWRISDADNARTARSSGLEVADKLMVFKQIFQRGTLEDFEDGMESKFSRELETQCRRVGAESIDVLSRLLEDERLSPRVLAEAMQWLGRAEQTMSSSNRLWLLAKGLASRYAGVRDAAAVGIASVDDPVGISFLERAIEVEPIQELKRDMEETLAQLRSHSLCPVI